MKKRDFLSGSDSKDHHSESESQQDASVISALTTDETPIPKAEELFYEVMTSSGGVPTARQHLRVLGDIGEERWECLNCGCWAQGLQCECGYHELAQLRLSEEDNRKLQRLETQLYWTCQCGFTKNTHNVEACKQCKEPNARFQENQERKQKKQIDDNKGALERLCSCF